MLRKFIYYKYNYAIKQYLKLTVYLLKSKISYTIVVEVVEIISTTINNIIESS